MKVFSLARYRHFQPEPPYWLGGELIRAGGRLYLRDAIGAIEIKGETDAETGALVLFEIVGKPFRARECRAVAKPNGERLPSSLHAREFPRFVHKVRAFFSAEGLSEIVTPTLVPCPGLEPSLEPFATTVTRGQKSRTVYLPTSPEIHLKKALAQGWSDIFEVKSCFRRGEFSEHHDNEFTMLEWYRGFADLDLVIADLRKLLNSLDGPKLEVTDFATLFQDILKFQLTPETTRQQLWELAGRLSLDRGDTDSFTDLFHRVMIEKIEPRLVNMGACIVRKFPPELAALAKLDANGWADRFEFYWRGLEIANAFFEVTDPEEQKRRWENEQKERARLQTTPLAQDSEMIEALEKGLPPTAGIALGVERLYMALNDVKDIRELRLFPTENLFRSKTISSLY
ncbi:MAG TPA: EF-P lysine aminoacylase GenX [Bdellovibrionales bacterium]|nr:EF-P lysine aminoacylase GenX [Bdellovibrionales bacterium]